MTGEMAAGGGDRDTKKPDADEGRIALRVGAQGRVIIPQSVLAKKGISEGDIVWVTVEKAEIR